MKRTDEAPRILLTPAQRALYDTVADAPEDAVKTVLRDYPRAWFKHLTRDDMLSFAVVGAMEAVTTHDPAEGASLRTWVFYAALHKVLENARSDGKRHAKVVAMLRAQHMVHFRHLTGTRIEVGIDGAAEIADKLHAESDTFYARAALKMAATEPPHEGDPEEAVGMREAAAWAGGVTRKVVGSIEPGERAMLDAHFREKKPLTEIAKEMGVPESQYRTFVRDFDKLLATLGKRMARLDMKEMPVWIPEVSGTALGSGG